MAASFYMDVHIPQAITDGLRRRTVDVLTAQEDDTDELDDPELLDRATQLNRVLFSFDTDFLSIAASRQQKRIGFAGVIHAHRLKVSTSTCLRDLELIAKASEPAEWTNRVEFLPL